MVEHDRPHIPVSAAYVYANAETFDDLMELRNEARERGASQMLASIRQVLKSSNSGESLQDAYERRQQKWATRELIKAGISLQPIPHRIAAANAEVRSDRERREQAGAAREAATAAANAAAHQAQAAEWRKRSGETCTCAVCKQAVAPV